MRSPFRRLTHRLATPVRSLALVAGLALTAPLHAEITVTGDVSPENDPATDPPNGFWGNGGDSSQRIYIGYNRTGTLTVDGGSFLQTGNASIGYNTHSMGTANISGPTTVWETQGLSIDSVLGSSLTLENQATVNATSASFGTSWNYGASKPTIGSLLLIGSGNTLNISGSLTGGGYSSLTNPGGIGMLQLDEGSVINVGGKFSLLKRTDFNDSRQVARIDGTVNANQVDTQTFLYPLEGSGTINTKGFSNTHDSGLSGIVPGEVQIFNGTNEISWKITGDNQDLDVNLTADGTGDNDARVLQVLEGADVQFQKLYGIDQTYDFPKIEIIVDGEGSRLQADSMRLGASSNYSVEVTNGAELRIGNFHLGSTYRANADKTATMVLSGPGSKFSMFTSPSTTGTAYIYGNGTMIVQDGAEAETYRTTIGGSTDTGLGKVIVNGPDTLWTNHNWLAVGNEGDGIMSIRNGAVVNSGYSGTTTYTKEIRLGSYYSDHGTIQVYGDGSQLNGKDQIVIGNEGAGTLNVGDGAAVNAGGDIVVRNLDNTTSSGTANLIVSGDSMLNAGTSGTGNFENNGTVRVMAGHDLATGTYAPISVGADSGSFTGAGQYLAYGGTWNDADHTFTASMLVDGGTGIDGTDLDAGRFGFDFDGDAMYDVVASFLDGAVGDEFTPTMISPATFGPDGGLVGAYSFSTNLDPATESTLLSFYVGGGLDEFEFWHLADGEEDWVLYTPETFSYDGEYVSFLVDGFSAYAVTAVPEPGTGLLVLLGTLGLLARRRRA